MPSTKELAAALVDELKKRNVAATLSTGANEYACTATINNIPASVYFSTDPEHGDIRWFATDDQLHRIPNRDIEPGDLAERIIDTFVNPAQPGDPHQSEPLGGPATSARFASDRLGTTTSRSATFPVGDGGHGGRGRSDHASPESAQG
jgi:hypothetical protein